MSTELESQLVRVLAELDALRGELNALRARMDGLEVKRSRSGSIPPPPLDDEDDELSEDEFLAICAAIAAFLGKRAHVQQIRLLGSVNWTQQGRIAIQGSHRL